MSSDIFSLKLGLNSCYLIRGKSTIMVDGGMPNKLRVFRRKLGRLYIHPEEIKLMVLTHSHFDHVGSAKAISVLLDTGEAFVGCLAHNGLPFRQNPGFPIYAQDINMVKESWRLLIDKGAKIIFPGHGNPFPVDIIRKELFS